MLAKGLRVALAGRDDWALERALEELGAHAERAMTVRMDVTDVASITRARRVVEERFGGVDVLVNNAAVLEFENEGALSIPADAYRRTFETNVFAVIEVCRVFAPPMAEVRYGRIVNVSSRAGRLATMSTYAPAYSMSKTTLNAFSRILAHTYRDSGVLVNAVDPGGSAPTWAVRRRRAHLGKVPTRLSGLPRCQMMARLADSSTIGARRNGRRLPHSLIDFHGHHSHRR